MRKTIHKKGDKRVRKFFALYPVMAKCFNGVIEYNEERWLEWVTVEQEYQEGGVDQLGYYGDCWIDIRFLDDNN